MNVTFSFREPMQPQKVCGVKLFSCLIANLRPSYFFHTHKFYSNYKKNPFLK